MMRNTARALALMLLAALLLASAVPAAAETDWRTLYRQVLERGRGTKQLAAPVDLTGDGVPELAVVSTDRSGVASIQLYTVSGGAATPMSVEGKGLGLDTFKLPGTRTAGMQLRMGASGQACLAVGLTASVKGQTVNMRLGLTGAGVVHAARRASNGQHQLDGKSVSEAQLLKGQKAFEAAYKKVGNLPSAAFSATASAKSRASRANTLIKRFVSFSTAKRVGLPKTQAALGVGDKLTLKATVSPATAAAALKWSSSHDAVATVAGGVVTAHAQGTATIYAEAAGGAKASCQVTVTGAKITGIKLGLKTLTLVKGSSHTLTATVQPKGVQGAVSWSSGNRSIALVDSNGTVQAVGAGQATITAKTANGLTASCKLVVINREPMIVDISSHNYISTAGWDWKKIKQNVDLLILRCGVTREKTQPVGPSIDVKFDDYAKKCKQYGIPFGVYYYGMCSDVETAKAEAKITWETAAPYDPLFYVYDAEEARLTKAIIETYIAELRDLGAKKVGAYIAHHRYNQYKVDLKLLDFVWIPHYGKNEGWPMSKPKFPCDLHQYSSMGRVEGFPGRVDVNRLTGTKSLAWFTAR
ncbi:Ig-like domain-containing protein [Bacillota bacterium Meth-B3]